MMKYWIRGILMEICSPNPVFAPLRNLLLLSVFFVEVCFPNSALAPVHHLLLLSVKFAIAK
jgi:hypothetical protein